MARFSGSAPASGDTRAARDRPAHAVKASAPLQAGRGRLSLRSTIDTLTYDVPAWLWPALLILAGTLLRAVPWLANYPLHRDEALYGTWAQLVIRGSDPAMLTAWADKPPLTLYLLAGSLGLFGISERAVRVPGMIAAVMTLVVTYGLARRLDGRRTALLAAALVATSPFAILFAPTAFTDPWLTSWLVAAAWAALAGRPWWSGVLLGLAVASKQTGVLGAPLVLALLWANSHGASENGATGHGACHPLTPASDSLLPRSASIWRAVRQSITEKCRAVAAGAAPGADPPRLRRGGRGGGLSPRKVVDRRPGLKKDADTFPVYSVRPYALALAGFALPMGVVIWWDSLRWGARPGFWTRSLETYGGLHLAHLAEWPERASRWSEPIGYLFGHPLATAGVLALAVVALAVTWRKRSAAPAEAGRARTNLILTAYCVGYLAVHFLVTFQPWDRYLLPLVPLLAILAAQGLLAVWRSVCYGQGRRASFLSWAAPAGVALLLAWSAWLGVNGRVPVGSGHEAYTGLDQIVSRIRTLPWSAVIYQRSLGWQLDFYFFQAPPARVWWEDPQTLVEDALYGVTVMPERQQWLVLSTAVDEGAGSAARQALAAHGLALIERQRVSRSDGTPSFILYEILPSGGPDA